MALYTYRSQSDLNRMLNAPKYNPNSQTMWNALGRTEGAAQANGGGDNFFTKTGKSLENAFGTTGATLYESGFNLLPAAWAGLTGADYTSHRSNAVESENQARRQDRSKALDDVYRQFGYDGREGFDKLVNDADARGDQAELDRLLKNDALNSAIANVRENYGSANDAAINAYNDYRNNNYASQKINQDRGKFAGSAINTLNTMADVGLMAAGIPAGVAFNSLQGATGGLADELEQNGGMNSTNIADWFGPNGVNWKQAGKNAIVGATTGAVTGALNKGLNKMVNPQTGNLFKGEKGLTKWLNDAGSKTALGRLGSTIATGATRGAISGAVGGATGAGLSTALNGGNFGDVVGNAAQGFAQGAKSGAITGGTMAGINKVANATLNRLAPNTAAAIRENQQRNASYGEGFFNQLDKAWHSGDSNFKQWLQGKPSRIIAGAGNIGNRISPVGSPKYNKAMGLAKRALKEFELADPYEFEESMINMAEAEGLDWNTARGKKQFTEKWLKDTTRNILTGGDDREMWATSLEDYVNQPELENGANPRNGGTVRNNELKALINDIRNFEQDPSTTVYRTVDPLGNRKEYTAQEVRQLIDEYENYKAPSILSGNSSSEVAEALGDAGVTLTEIFRNRNGGMFDPYSRADGEAFNNWVQSTKAELENTTDPTTIGGWVKRAGKRFVEDANQRGVGLGIKDVSDDYQTALNRALDQGLSGPELGDVVAEYSGLPKSVTGDDLYRLAQNNTDLQNALSYVATQMADEGLTPTYDSVANDPGYWNEVRAQYAQAQNYEGPGEYFESADTYEQVTPTRPTQTAGSGFDRIAQEAGYNNYDEVIQAYLQANPGVQLNPKGAAGQILNWLDSNPNTANNELNSVFEPEARNRITNRNKAQDLGQQLQNVSKQQKYRALYDSLDAKTAQRAVQTNAPDALTEMGVKPENYLEAAKTSNYINQVVSDLADKSGVKVYVPDMTNKLAAATDDVILTENAAKKFTNAVRQIVADGSTPDEYSAGYLIEKSREFGNKAANLRGNTDDVKTLRDAYNNVKYVLRDAAADALADANITGADTNQKIANGLAKIGANQKIVDYYTALNNDGKAPTAKDYIRRSSLFEQARDMGTQVAAEKLTRSASKAPTRGLTKLLRASGVDQPLELILNNTVAPIAGVATNLVGKAVEGVGNIGARIGGERQAPTTMASTQSAPTANTTPATQLYNMIGRSEGLSNAEQANTAQYLANAAQEAEIVPKAPNAGSLEDLVSPSTTTASTSVYDSVYGAPTTSYSGLQETGDYWTDLIGRAMLLAEEADDANAFGALFSMYQNALSNLQSASSSSSATKLTDKQRQANAAAVALEDFAQSEPNFAYDVSDIPVIGGIANLGGNDYQSKAEALALQVGYMLSGATVNKDEAKKIGMAYVPQPRDNATVRQNKLNQLRGIISEYQRTTAE